LKVDSTDNLIIGAGVSGLSLSYYLKNSTLKNTLIEKSGAIGGNCKTIDDNGFYYDIGGHRFYTKNVELENDIRELLGDDLLKVGRKSSIYVNNKFVNYPLQLLNSLRAFSFPYIFVVLSGYFYTKTFKRKVKVITFEDWVSKQFGKILYKTFFKGYSEKVWGLKCNELTADFAAERIRTLTLWKAIKDIVFKYKNEASLVKTFLYPRFGFGMIPVAFEQRIKSEDKIIKNTVVTKIIHSDNKIRSVELSDNSVLDVQNIVNTVDFEAIVTTFEPSAPKEVIEASKRLVYRDLIIAHVKLDREILTDNLWIYFPGEDEVIARLHEPKNWSKDLSPEDKTSVVIEIFAFKGKGIWNKSEDEILEIVYSELTSKLKLFKTEEIIEGKVIKVEKAYPIYTNGYKDNLKIINDYFSRFDNFYNIGRSASFKYTSTDFYILMGKELARALTSNKEFNSKDVLLEGVYAEE